MTPTRRPLREGLVLGAIAYVAVAAFYALFDILAARGPLYTLNLLGQAVFRGLRDPAVLQHPLTYDVGAMMLYNGLHCAVSLLIGFAVAGLAFLPDRRPELARPAGIFIISGFFVTILAVGILSTPFRPLLPWWSIVVANSCAVILAGWYLLRRYPGIGRRLLPVRTAL